MDHGYYLRKVRGVLTSALGITILLGTPLIAQADQGKWWKPKEGDPRVERRERTWDGRGQGARDQGSWRRGAGSRGNVYYRDGRFGGGASWGGGFGWRGAPVRRDILVIRDYRSGGFFRARRVYCAPRYYGRFVYVRPVRYFVAADACIGPLTLRARIVRPHYIYGCNFCDARFDSYDAYCNHVEHCDHRPSGCEISVSNWDNGGDDWDGPYQTDDNYRGDDRRYDDHGSCGDHGSYDDHGSYGDDRDDDYGDDGGYYDDGR